MLEWVIDNVTWLLLGLGMVALCFAAAWWTRRKDKLLIGVAVPGLLMLVVWLLSLFIITDRMQLVSNVEAMRDLINAGKLAEAVEHFDDEVKVDGMGGAQTVKKADLQALARLNMQRHNIKKVVTNKIEVEEVTRPNAKVTFYLGPEDSSERGRCIMGFVQSPDGKWRVKTVTVESVVGGQKLPLVAFPF